jgi:hypothetical protein
LARSFRLGGYAIWVMSFNIRGSFRDKGKAKVPTFVKDGEIERFYVRTGPATTELSASQTQEYIKQRFR